MGAGAGGTAQPKVAGQPRAGVAIVVPEVEHKGLKQGTPDPTAIHWGFVADNDEKVDEFYDAATSAGARDNISPRARLEYYPGYYEAPPWPSRTMSVGSGFFDDFRDFGRMRQHRDVA
jgi:hypothetical protein